MNQKYKIEGLEGLIKKLDELPRELSNKAELALNRNAANAVKKVLVNASPASRSNRKVKIKKSVSTQRIPNTKTGIQVGWLKKAFFVKFFVFGTKMRRTKKNKANRGRITGRDFVSPALNGVLPRVGESLSKNYNKIIERILKKKTK